jgi:predicted  nucleic acid-binding Zn-ribbon protein
MDETQRRRCSEFARLLFGRSLKSGDIEGLAKQCSSYEEFRIRLVLQLSISNEVSQRIATRWRDALKKSDDTVDANVLLHMLEALADRQAGLEQQMRQANVELLDKLKAIDGAASAQAVLRTNLEEYRAQIAAIRAQLEHMDDIPAQ